MNRVMGATADRAARLLTFAGEGHGFRQAVTTVCAPDAEPALYAQVFGPHPPGVPRLELVQ
ncbi:hypothetical protein QFZ66_001628 [Streptomyces sp. B4I13]|uniref:hypothetical protein n=1 Tax=Streptomyces sp. B4I13 TaxID=3042271 RepID=UPI0027892C15|nr:hypothetical protein [Streptomyces sp. B4I13]MDQ0957750.1 hypothetical protein [Streptomyces sp. B4I13]